LGAARATTRKGRYPPRTTLSRCLTGIITASVSRSLPIPQATILKERHARGLSLKCSEAHDLERAVAIAHDVEQGLRVCRVGITDDGDLPWLREGIGQRLEPLTEA
jgi:hypothetical protein